MSDYITERNKQLRSQGKLYYIPEHRLIKLNEVPLSRRARVNFKNLPEHERFHNNDPLPATVNVRKDGRLDIEWDNGHSCVIYPKYVNIYKLELKEEQQKMVNFNIQAKASKILRRHDYKKKSIEYCCKAGICPICGEKLEVVEKINKYKNKLFFGLITETREYKSFRVFCPQRHKIIHPELGQINSLGSIIWEDCITEVGKKHKENYSHYPEDSWI
jgi:hypothetical protein